MKENMFDVLMYLFENYMDETDAEPDRESLRTELVEAGFADTEVNKALAWLDGLVDLRLDPALANRPGRALRVFAPEECERLGVAARGFLIFLEQAGVLDNQTRELVLDRLMALDGGEIDLEQLKWVVLMVLFNQPGREAEFAWIEDLVFDQGAGSLH